MSATDQLDGRILNWKQGTIYPGSFGQLRAGTWLEVQASSYGDLSSLVGGPITLSFIGGPYAGLTWTSTVSNTLPGGAGIQIEDKWDTVGKNRTLFASGLVQLSFPKPPEEVLPPLTKGEIFTLGERPTSTWDLGFLKTLFPDSPIDEGTNPGGALPQPDPTNALSSFFAPGLQPNAAVNEKVNCNCKNWLWLVLVAGLAYLYLRK